jgi:UDP-3-O-[3-hydroxymyristoyl] glucosamine N-acyltransferase
MGIALQELARLVDASWTGDGSRQIEGAAILRDVRVGEITFADNSRLEQEIRRSAAAAVVVPPTFQPLEPLGMPCIVASDVRATFGRIVAYFRPPRQSAQLGISPAAHVSPTARLGDDVQVHPAAVIGDDVQIGRGTVIHAGVCIMAGCRLAEDVVVFPHAVLYENTVVGARSIIHAGAVLGAYGFGYDSSRGRHELCAQLGYVELGEDVEIGAATTIDRGTYGPTSIGDGTKIDNQVMIGHNCRIGRHNLLCSQVGIAGSVTTGDYVVMAGQVGVRDHIQIGDGVVLGARSGVGSDILQAGKYFGAPARPDREQLQIIMAQQKVPAMRRQLKALQQALDQLAGAQRSSDAASDAA